jgi:hypothetical protein
MYAWLWRVLPGGFGGKLVTLILLVALAVAVLWFLVFPWAVLHVPIDRVGVTG